jgi:asparagine synthase (glutamine-hydrolysing)
MCGIAGSFDLSGAPSSAAIVKRMTDVIAHRGPDGEGVWVDGAVGLGHRRLAIIDLSEAGRQPMATPDGRFVVTYNGELYNFQELRTELQALGHRFRSRSDTEVLLAAFAEWGLAALPRFNGMFAFAIWDRLERRLVLARDRFGVKPLYWARVGTRLLFGSEVKAILAAPGVGATLDREALAEYLTFQNFFTDRTLFAGVKLLPPGTSLVVAPGREPVLDTYWDFDFRESSSESPAELAEECDRLFRQAVSRQLISDVPVGAYLSGGIDSGAITAVAAPQLPGMRTFTVGFDLNSASGLELGFDERSKAEYMSYLFGTEHYQMVLKAGDMERAMSALVWHLEEPRVGQCYPNFYAAKLASKFGKVVLAGTGGDELFGGYPWRYYRAVVNDDFEHYVDKYYGFWQRLVPNQDLHRVLAPIWNDVKHVWTRDIFRDTFRRHANKMTRPEDYVNHSLYLEAKTFLHGLLVVDDKLAMAHGLEGRVPFLDNDLVDFAMRMPVSQKLGNLGKVAKLDENTPGSKPSTFFEKTSDGKLLLRQVMSRYVPDTVANAVKQGFSAPDATWFRGDSIDYVKRVLFDRKAAIYDVLDRAAVLGLVQEHLDGKHNRRLLVWSLLYLETFLKTFMTGSSVGERFHG